VGRSGLHASLFLALLPGHGLAGVWDKEIRIVQGGRDRFLGVAEHTCALGLSYTLVSQGGSPQPLVYYFTRFVWSGR
jgi:hypothetical protein